MGIDNLTEKVSATLNYLVDAQELHSLNIANVNNKNYIAKKIDFDKFISFVDGAPNDTNAALISNAISKATLEMAETNSLDDQIARTEQVASQYEELLEVLGRHMSLYNIALNKGR